MTEEFIEEAAKVIHQNYSETSWEEATSAERGWARGTVRAVFEKAHTPTYSSETASALKAGMGDSSRVAPTAPRFVTEDGLRTWVAAPTDDEREVREAAWQDYLLKMRELDAQNNLAGRGLIPSHRDWHAGWDARAARRSEVPEPSPPLRITIEHEGGNSVTGTPEQVLNHGHLKPGWRCRSSEPQGEPSEAAVHAAGVVLYGVSWGDDAIADPDLVRTALRAAATAVTDQGETR